MSRQAAEERYRQRRNIAYREAERRLIDRQVVHADEVMLREIPMLSLQVTILEWGSARRVAWDWRKLLLRFQQNDPDRFDLAVFGGNQICAFALGKPSKSRSHCTLEYVEASPDPSHPFNGRVLPIVITALERYCVAIRSAEMRVVEPLAALIPVYTGKYGFSVAPGPGSHQYLSREVRP